MEEGCCWLVEVLEDWEEVVLVSLVELVVGVVVLVVDVDVEELELFEDDVELVLEVEVLEDDVEVVVVVVPEGFTSTEPDIASPCT